MARTKAKKAADRNERNGNMPRQPPLPQGPPPSSDWDTYRPREQSQPRRDSQGAGEMFHFRGNAGPAPGTSTYRPNYDERRSPPRMRSPPRYNDRGPNYDTRSRDEANSYRPSEYRPSYIDRRDDRNEGFTFRQEAPARLDFDQAHRPRSPRHRQQDNADRYRANNRNIIPSRGRGGYRGRAGPRLASNRDFLKTNREKTPELMHGMDIENGAVTYKDIADMSDSEEAEMDMSDSDGEAEKEQPRKRFKALDGDSVSKWSNPDPYTVLPPPDAADRKKKDVVKLIRKARVSTGPDTHTRTTAVTDDFISFDDFGDDEFVAPAKPDLFPSGPSSKAFHPPSPPPLQQVKVSVPGMEAYEVSSIPNTRPPAGFHIDPRNGSFIPNNVNNSTLPSKPVAPVKKAVEVIDLEQDPNLGSRKRTRNDVLKPPPHIHAPTTGKGARKPDGSVTRPWRPVEGANPTPWVLMDHSKSASVGVWLHKEIMDFYHFVRPRGFEGVIRQKLIDNLRLQVKAHYKPNAEILAFGSFPAGLYLPTADMDLVCCSTQFLEGGRAILASKNSLYNFGEFIKRQSLALNNKVEVIAGAKVPLVKYVCATTGLKVDISFENNTGLVANKTFQDWKREFPAMPILVTLVKHFLAMRGLNEPVNGGIGGFSVICLVVSMLQHMPQVQSRSMQPEHHLGETLMEFFDLYGNQFNTMTTAIQLKPPAYISKSRLNLPYRNAHEAKFSIIDPNRVDNDISGGSSNTLSIRRSFSDAYSMLQRRMGEINNVHNNSGAESILDSIIGGNYSTFELQREHLAHVHEHLFGPVDRS